MLLGLVVEIDRGGRSALIGPRGLLIRVVYPNGSHCRFDVLVRQERRLREDQPLLAVELGGQMSTAQQQLCSRAIQRDLGCRLAGYHQARAALWPMLHRAGLASCGGLATRARWAGAVRIQLHPALGPQGSLLRGAAVAVRHCLHRVRCAGGVGVVTLPPRSTASTYMRLQAASNHSFESGLSTAGHLSRKRPTAYAAACVPRSVPRPPLSSIVERLLPGLEFSKSKDRTRCKAAGRSATTASG